MARAHRIEAHALDHLIHSGTGQFLRQAAQHSGISGGQGDVVVILVFMAYGDYMDARERLNVVSYAVIVGIEGVHQDGRSVSHFQGEHGLAVPSQDYIPFVGGRPQREGKQRSGNHKGHRHTA
ncbi:MAG: hypothetical protein A2Z21_00795 [Candidatus Fraserbacteria bacterium RBG_16_55_9]|uniref:Uncharacterized protein n=1 Tax=Fraserbacteria sp. (strain RBG_16_55_9) TaxID=1817864 RepID=A0A1F5UXM7_FRAXR|nr:MAG: hypothetical protein A2Z21_00795 [Candidatus Fraserbacteria bacterium RBG_16_55_9]